MAKDEDFKLLKIQTHVLRVNIHCDGCRDKVKKLLTKIEGVFSVNIDVDLQKVTVVGNIDADTLIRKLNRAGKYAELWSNKPNNNNNNHSNHKNSNNAPQKNQKQNNAPQNQKQVQFQNPKDQGKQNLMQGLKTFKNQHKGGGKVPDIYSDDDLSDEFDDDDDDEEDFDEEDLRMLGEKMGQLNFLKQMNNHAQQAANNNNNHGNNNKNHGNNNAHNNNNNNGKKNANGNGKGNNDGKKNQNVNNQNQQGKIANAQSVLNFGGVNGKMMPNLAHGNGKMMPNLGQLGGDPAKRVNALNNMQAMNSMMNGLHGPSGHQNNVNGGALNHQNHNAMMGMHHHHPTAMMAGNNARNGNVMMMHDGARYMQQQQPQMHDGARYMQQQQPQMMYARSPQVMPYTGYYGYNPNPNVYYGYNNNNNNNNNNNGYYASPYHGESIKNGDGIGDMFSDENTKGCAIM
ncbi:hypothetical protein LUZ60_009879 [Juncus effusus]|nr:hypothetical protein LUZ60_009879 [Juncus effusus]